MESINQSERQSTHWQGCWRTHHECAVVLLERILASDDWAAECAELGCTDADHSSRSVASLTDHTGAP